MKDEALLIYYHFIVSESSVFISAVHCVHAVSCHSPHSNRRKLKSPEGNNPKRTSYFSKVVTPMSLTDVR